MKKLLLIILPILLSAISFGCEKEVTPPPPQKISFTGHWVRTFSPIPNSPHYVNYYIYQDSIRYILDGALGDANYLLYRDYFDATDNRFIGHTLVGKQYLIFVKEQDDNTISLYKQEIDDIESGKAIAVPSDTTTQNHGWNTYQKN